ETVRGRAVDVPIEFLHILAVIALRPADAENTFFQKRIALVPKRKGEAKPSFEVGNAADAIFVPAIRTRAGVVVREVIPGVAVRAVIFAYRPPGALGQVRPPEMPRLRGGLVFLESSLLGVHAGLI